jgi:glycosyltransferase involved in cell wall biosynthesis
MRLLYISSIDYRFTVKQRSQYFGELLSQWHTVDFISLTDWYALLQIITRKQKIIERKYFSNLYVHYVVRLPLNRLRVIFNINSLIKKIVFSVLIKKNKYDFIIITNPIDYQLLPPNINSKIVYDCMDKMDAFVKNDGMKIIINQEEEKLTKQATFVTCVSEALKSYLNKYREDITVIKNGVDLELFKKISLQNMNSIRSSTFYKLGFIGTIAEWVDVDFIKKIANKIPKMQFYFIGPLISYNSKEIENGKNIFYLGVKPHKDIPLLIKNLDICLFPFKISDVSKYSNPIKIYEYLALGKPVLARYWPELKNEFGDLIYYYHNSSEFIELVSKITKQGESKELIEKRKQFAYQNSWEVKVKQFNKLLENYR